MKNIVIAGYYGYQNSGDDAILHSICDDIKSLSEEVSITVLSNQPDLTMREYPVKAVNRFGFSQVRGAIKSCDILLMGGGSLIQDVTSTRSLYYYLAILWMAKIYKKKIVLYGNGIGPVTKWFNKPSVRLTLNTVDIITLREHLSIDVLKKLKVDKPEIEVTADPVFNLKVHEDMELENMFTMERIPTDKKLVGVMFRSWSHEESYTKKMAKICDKIVEDYGYHIVFIPLKHPTDIIVSNEIAKKMHHKATIIEHRYHEEKLIMFISKLHMVLSMRLHGLIYSALHGVPMIGFNYDPKVAYYANELNIPVVDDMRHLHNDEIMGFIEDIEENYVSHQENINIQLSRLKNEAGKNREYLEKLL